MSAVIKYSDSLIEISDDGIRFKKYSMLLRSRFVPFSDIERIDVFRDLKARAWRLWGTKDFLTYYPLDFNRYKRNIHFLAYMRQGSDIGFSAEDPLQVVHILKKKELISDTVDSIPELMTEVSHRNMMNPGRKYFTDDRKKFLLFAFFLGFLPLIGVIWIVLSLIFGWEFIRGW